MPDITGTTRAQTLFLRAFRTNPAGPPPELWPAPALFRKWLRRPTFRSARQTVLAAVRYQTDLHLALAACNSARQLASQPADAPLDEPPNPHQLFRLHHLRQRFQIACGLTDQGPIDPKPPTKPEQLSEREWVRSMNGDESIKAYDELVALKQARWAREKAEAQARAQTAQTSAPSNGAPQTQ